MSTSTVFARIWNKFSRFLMAISMSVILCIDVFYLLMCWRISTISSLASDLALSSPRTLRLSRIRAISLLIWWVMRGTAARTRESNLSLSGKSFDSLSFWMSCRSSLIPRTYSAEKEFSFTTKSE